MEIKKLTAGILAAAFFSAAGCGAAGESASAGKTDWRQIVGAYGNEKKTMIAAWGNPNHSYASYKTAAEMGLTHIFMDDAYAAFEADGETGKGSAAMEEMQTWFAELGLKAIWQAGRWAATGASSLDVSKYAGFKHFSCMEGINIYDEPTFNALPGLVKEAKAFDETFGKDLLCFINVWPSSGGSNIGGTYADYLGRYKEVLLQIEKGRRMVSSDVYPLLDRGGTLEIDGSWLVNMFLLKTLAKEIDAEFQMFIQSVGYVGHRRPRSLPEINYQVWTDLCFGITGYTYFTYAGKASADSWKYTDAIVSTDKESRIYDQTYYDACRYVNQNVSKLDAVYHSFDWKGVLVSLGKGTEIDSGLFSLDEYALPSSEVAFIENRSSLYGTCYGVYQDEAGQEGLVITNYTDPAKQLSNTVNITFKDRDTVLLYRNGEWEADSCPGGEWEIVLEPGEGVFAIPVRLKKS